MLTTKRWEIVRAMTGAGPLAIREAARRVGRDVKAVHRDVHALLNAGDLRKTDDRTCRISIRRDSRRCDVERGVTNANSARHPRQFAERIAAMRSPARCFTLSLLSWPQAAMMSRPRGVRTGEA